MLSITPELAIPEPELRFVYSRSSGPGGQNVNKVETRVTLLFDLASPSLGPGQRQRLAEALATRVNRAGVLRVVCQRHRTQAANQREAVERFVELLRQALAEPEERVATRPPARVRRRRLEDKRRQAWRKRLRGRPEEE